ncbi:HugZ family pyridoxamine 5'-phosphate oxidase [Cylindrospermum sp. FACHB-282]|uniref:HugZ family pyridoxamine 5'-phosphate oxidase n=1 Tax=Cylindrospermum sp. FACHB-282 TaxID=2692794 RepID=UPI0016881F3B|nr:pyridoxamine 5'-phosphate oxidase family protein [Cylindrospermum sp. FACHB-282]MBD2386646.1 pyridoxamine 5'-phosphate oxidase family protein [Cylindrospermum sp. FACHB-282]
MSQLEKAQAEYEKFPQEFASIIIGTVDVQGIPNASYAPFWMDDSKNIYIYVSGLSTHTKNIYINPHVSVLFIEDEAKADQVFARRRLSFDCTASLIDRETDKWNYIVDQFQGRFGQIVDLLRGLSDFRIFQLTPSEGRFVIGFGAAYHISGENLNQLVQITGDKAG